MYMRFDIQTNALIFVTNNLNWKVVHVIDRYYQKTLPNLNIPTISTKLTINSYTLVHDICMYLQRIAIGRRCVFQAHSTRRIKEILRDDANFITVPCAFHSSSEHEVIAGYACFSSAEHYVELLVFIHFCQSCAVTAKIYFNLQKKNSELQNNVKIGTRCSRYIPPFWSQIEFFRGVYIILLNNVFVSQLV